MQKLKRAQLLLRNFKYEKATSKNVGNFIRAGNTINLRESKGNQLIFMRDLQVSPINHRNILTFNFSTF